MTTRFGAGFLQVLLCLGGAVMAVVSASFNGSQLVADSDIVPSLVIFGDSTVDAGNNNYLVTVVKSNFAPYGRSFEGGRATGRFCDGYLVTDYIAQKLGLPLGLPYLAPNAHGDAILTGINFASSASGWFDNTASHFGSWVSAVQNVKGLTSQFEWYKNWKQEVLTVAGPQRGHFIISNALYIFSTGSNDWVNNYYLNPVLMNQYTPDAYTTFLLTQVRQYVQELYDLGGRNVAVLGLPPLGCLPSQISLHGKGSQGCVKEFNDVVVSFNAQLQAVLNDMKAHMPGSRVVYIDAYTYLYTIFQNPQPYGFTATRQGCCGTGDLETAILCNQASVGTCGDAYPFLFWDSFHPTTHFYSQLADQVYASTRPIIGAPPQP